MVIGRPGKVATTATERVVMDAILPVVVRLVEMAKSTAMRPAMIAMRSIRTPAPACV
jgi:hypothetical protein